MLPTDSVGLRYGFEIGAGVGVLTRELSRTCEKVICVEIDEALKPVLAETLADCPNVEMVWGDVLKLDLKRLFADKFNIPLLGGVPEGRGGADIICCANLPYYITSPVIMRLLEERLPLKSLTVMVQKEAAVRLCASPGTRDSGAVSYAVRYYSTPKKLFDVSRGSFLPAPNVDSAVIRLDVHPERRFGVTDEAFLFRIIRAAFSQRRKQLVNPVSAELCQSKEVVRGALLACGINPAARAEELTLENFINLHKELRK
jgi:16S rRNA (adenine1518-N6/adenine1519-N6)-dimethyltransferase